LLKGGTSQLVLEHYRYNTSRMPIFSKTYHEDTLRCPYKDYSSLNRWQPNRNLLSIQNLPSFRRLELFRPVLKSGAILLLEKVEKAPTLLVV
jgi:hypothetical protein